MAISRYPRFGVAIAPKSLAPLLQAPVPVPLEPLCLIRYPLLADLDDSVWISLTEAECRACGEAVVNQIWLQRSSQLLDTITFPLIDNDVRLELLDLEVRTFNCLSRALEYRRITSLRDLHCLSANELWKELSGFGVKCLVDLFVAMEHAVGAKVVTASRDADDSQSGSVFRVPNSGALTNSEVLELLKNPEAVAAPGVRSRLFPLLSPSLRINDLRMPVRVRNCLQALVKEGVISTLGDLSRLSLGELLSRKNFGKKSLLDLLESVSLSIAPEETLSSTPAATPVPSSRQLTRSAERLRDLKYASMIRCNDLRLSRYLQPLLASANAASDSPPLAVSASLYAVGHRLVGRTHDMEPESVLVQIRQLRASLSSLLRVSLERELSQVVVSAADARRAAMFLRYHGWDGRGVSTLQAVGELNGLTRERIRQVSAKVEKVLRRSNPFLPALSRAARLISRHLPIDEQSAQALLRRSSITDGDFQLDGLIDAAKFFGRSLTFTLEGPATRRTLARADQVWLASATKRIARKSVSRFGLATVADLQSQVGELTPTKIDVGELGHYLRRDSGLRWLDEGEGWFWISDLPKNHLVTVIRKVLSVAPKIHISELRSAISEDPKGMGYAPPGNVVAAFCVQACGCALDGGFITSTAQLNPASILSPAEHIQYDVLQRHGPLLTRQELERLCCESGMNIRTSSMYATRSPIIARYAHGVYGLRGVAIAPGQIDEIRARPTRVLVQDHGWTADAKLWVLSELSPNVLATGAFQVPASIRNILAGKFLLRSDDGATLGALVLGNVWSWGLGTLFTRRGGEPGDFLFLRFDLGRREVVAQIAPDPVAFGDVDV